MLEHALRFLGQVEVRNKPRLFALLSRGFVSAKSDVGSHRIIPCKKKKKTQDWHKKVAKPGIDPGTSELWAQHANHCAISLPKDMVFRVGATQKKLDAKKTSYLFSSFFVFFWVATDRDTYGRQWWSMLAHKEKKYKLGIDEFLPRFYLQEQKWSCLKS